MLVLLLLLSASVPLAVAVVVMLLQSKPLPRRRDVIYVPYVLYERQEQALIDAPSDITCAEVL
jgi:hypothetical protein